MEQTVEYTEKSSSLRMGNKVWKVEVPSRINRTTIQGGQGVRNIMVLKELYDKLSEFLILLSLTLIDEEIFGGIHVSPVFTLGLPFTDGMET
jgi:hypothetical protein